MMKARTRSKAVAQPEVILVAAGPSGVYAHDLLRCPCKSCSFHRVLAGREALDVAKRSKR